MRKLRMLAACEMSGRVRDAFAARGWEAWSADFLPSESPAFVSVTADAKAVTDSRNYPNGNHYQGDVLELFQWGHPVNKQVLDFSLSGAPGRMNLWDLIIAFPPCTHLSGAGARYWREKQADGRQQEAAEFFLKMAAAPAPLTAVENPVGIMGRKENPLYRVPDQIVQPWMFGDPVRKKTCLWLKGLPLLVADNPVEPEGRVATGGGSWRTDQAHGRGANNGHEDSEGRARRHIVRSRTLPGFARAMADQWGPFAEQYYA